MDAVTVTRGDQGVLATAGALGVLPHQAQRKRSAAPHPSAVGVPAQGVSLVRHQRTMVSAMVTALGGGRTAGAGAVAHQMATAALQLMGAARALEMTGALVLKATLMMTMDVVHQEAVNPPENLPSRFVICSVLIRL